MCSPPLKQLDDICNRDVHNEKPLPAEFSLATMRADYAAGCRERALEGPSARNLLDGT